MFFIKKTFPLLFVFFLTSCSVLLTEVSIITDKDVSFKNVNLNELPQRHGVEGEDKRFFVLFPFSQPTIQGAVKDALHKGKGDILIDAAIYVEFWSYLVFSKYGYRVVGTVVQTENTKEGW